ncbi:hypothetical protein BD769DRAFT_1439948 [Suillus cothurnatus]|nr:hypothetical protein BD769DRAFT_1439948 [Suillus cothurnatus]
MVVPPFFVITLWPFFAVPGYSSWCLPRGPCLVPRFFLLVLHWPLHVSPSHCGPLSPRILLLFLPFIPTVVL